MSGYKVTEGHFAPAGKFAIRRDDFAVMGLAYTAETAALFAAAPAMLEALRNLIEAKDKGMGQGAVDLRYDLARDVIAKAEGRPQ